MIRDVFIWKIFVKNLKVPRISISLKFTWKHRSKSWFNYFLKTCPSLISLRNSNCWNFCYFGTHLALRNCFKSFHHSKHTNKAWMCVAKSKLLGKSDITVENPAMIQPSVLQIHVRRPQNLGHSTRLFYQFPSDCTNIVLTKLSFRPTQVDQCSIFSFHHCLLSVVDFYNHLLERQVLFLCSRLFLFINRPPYQHFTAVIIQIRV